VGFNLSYIPIKHIKKGGILNRYNDITNQKFAKTKNHNYLIYPSLKILRDVKNKCKFLIKILLKKSVMEVLNKINPIINGFSDYYA
jgi:hypothetical protein